MQERSFLLDEFFYHKPLSAVSFGKMWLYASPKKRGDIHANSKLQREQREFLNTRRFKVKMPDIRLQHVVSVSSEDKLHKAENLLKPSGGGGKWKCGKPGEAMAAVIFQLERETAIDSIHVGNEGSAFVEVLVGKAAASSDKDFQVLLVNSMLMNPIESRNNTNINGVRIFKSDSLMKPVSSQKWDRVKVVCTQPFNKTVTYGLSFIKLLSPEEEEEQATSEKAKKFGAFSLKKEEGADESSSMSRFLATGKLPDARKAGVASGATAATTTGAHASSSVAVPRSDAAATTSSSREKNARSLPAANSPVSPIAGSSKAVATTASGSTKRPGDEGDRISSKKSKPTDRAGEKPVAGSSGATATSVKNAESVVAASPFDRLFSGVVFVLSGFQNPLRSDLRDMAIQMGARYRPDWDSTCTHLICAFPNTPKFNEVVSRGGSIVSKNWIVDCNKQRRLLPWKNYSMLPASVAEPKAKGEPGHSLGSDAASSSKPALKDKTEIKTDDTTKDDGSHGEDDDVDYGGSTDVDSENEGSVHKMATDNHADDIDTEDEIDSVRGHTKATCAKSETSEGCSSVDVPSLPEYFAGMSFFFYGDLPQREILERYVVAYGGEIEPYMTDKVTHVITAATWDRNFDDAKHVNPNVAFVTPKWIIKVHDVQKLVSYSAYEIRRTGLVC